MESYVAPWAQWSQEINLQRLTGEQFLSTYDYLVKAAQSAVLPFHFHISPAVQGLRIHGDLAAVMVASRIIEQIIGDTPVKRVVDESLLRTTIADVITKTLRGDLVFRLNGLPRIVPMSLSQVAFMQMLLSPDNQLIFGLGPTGTGKTHLAIAAALNQLAEERVKHIVITRPHIVMEGEILTAATRQEVENDIQLNYFEDILHDLISHQGVTQLILISP